MPTINAIPWKRLAAEGAAIIISILIAFGIDAWWDERAERLREQQQLLALKSELQGMVLNVDQIRQSISHHSRLIDQLIVALRDSSGQAVEVPNEWLGAVVSWRTADVSVSTFESLRASGGLQLVEDPVLRVALGGLPAVLLDVVEDENIGRDFVETKLGPYLAEIGLAEAAYSNRLGFREEQHGGLSLVKANDQLLGMLVARQVHINWSLRQLPELQEYFSDIIVLIDAEVDDD